MPWRKLFTGGEGVCRVVLLEEGGQRCVVSRPLLPGVSRCRVVGSVSWIRMDCTFVSLPA